MKVPFLKQFSLCAATLTLSLVGLNAATTDPVGYVTVSIPAGTTGAPSVSVISLPLYGTADIPGAESGTISAATVNTVTIASAGWTPDTLDVTGSPFFLKINTGALQGSTFLIEDNTSDTLTLKTDGLDISGLDSSSDSATIIPGDTVASAFGTPADGVIGGTGASDADVIYVLAGAVWKALFYSNANTRWEEVDLPFFGSRDDIVIPPYSAIIYQRVGAQYDLVSAGAVPVDQIQLPTSESGTVALATVVPADTTLGELGIENLSNWRAVGDSGVTSADADLVYIFDGGIWKGCYYNSNLSQWLQPSLEFFGDQSTLPIQTGSGYIVSRNGAGGAETLTIATPY